MYNSEIPTNAAAINDLVDATLACTDDQSRSAALLSLIAGLKKQPALAGPVIEHMEALYFNPR